MVYDEGVVLSKPGSGRYIARENLGFAYERIPAREAMRKLKETPVDRSGKVAPKTVEEQAKKLETDLSISQDLIKQL